MRKINLRKLNFMKNIFQTSNKFIGIDNLKSIMRKTTPTPLLVIMDSLENYTDARGKAG